MSKKLTSNTFDGGLVKDYHPLTTLNNILTDALNATFVTMNGNEAILQNDMGNGRVESAFLPNGYVPVGMKEYGGIIYVASYNPITNKSQLGCFPSPERNIDLEETGNPETVLELVNEDEYIRTYKFEDFNSIDYYQKGLGLLTNKLLIFGDGKIIRSGDKFGLYFKKIEGSNNSISDNNVSILANYDYNKEYKNGRTNVVTTPDTDGGYDVNNNYKNNLVTLSVQVLDSSNNLRDLTSQLKRIDPEKREKINFDIERLKNLSSDDKFNSGYFISSESEENQGDPVTEERKKQEALNTYNNKLFGSLYLVGNLNTVLYIDTSVQVMTSPPECVTLGQEGIWEKPELNCPPLDNSKKALMFYVDYYYNFPDLYIDFPYIVCNFAGNFYELNESPNNPDEERCGVEPIKGNVGYKHDIIRDLEGVITNVYKEVPTYDKLTNLYRQRFVGFFDVTDFLNQINNPTEEDSQPIQTRSPRVQSTSSDITYEWVYVGNNDSMESWDSNYPACLPSYNGKYLYGVNITSGEGEVTFMEENLEGWESDYTFFFVGLENDNDVWGQEIYLSNNSSRYLTLNDIMYNIINGNYFGLEGILKYGNFYVWIDLSKGSKLYNYVLNKANSQGLLGSQNRHIEIGINAFNPERPKPGGITGKTYLFNWDYNWKAVYNLIDHCWYFTKGEVSDTLDFTEEEKYNWIFDEGNPNPVLSIYPPCLPSYNKNPLYGTTETGNIIFEGSHLSFKENKYNAIFGLVGMNPSTIPNNPLTYEWELIHSGDKIFTLNDIMYDIYHGNVNNLSNIFNYGRLYVWVDLSNGSKLYNFINNKAKLNGFNGTNEYEIGIYILPWSTDEQYTPLIPIDKLHDWKAVYSLLDHCWYITYNDVHDTFETIDDNTEEDPNNSGGSSSGNGETPSGGESGQGGSSSGGNTNPPVEYTGPTILNYIVIPRLKLPEKGEDNLTRLNSKKLTHIATEGSIDLSKIGSGVKNVNTWRYTCDGKTQVNLNWGLEDYPLESDVLGPVYMDFYDRNTRENVYLKGVPPGQNEIPIYKSPNYSLVFNKTNYNGSFLDTIYLDDDSLKPRHIYLVRIHRTENGIDTTLAWKILITTPLYNSLWSLFNDYCDGNNAELKKAIKELNTIPLSFEIKELNNSNTGINYSKESIYIVNGNSFTKLNGNVQFLLFNNLNINNEYVYVKFASFTINNTLEIKLKVQDIYPFDIHDETKIKYDISSDVDINDDMLGNIIGDKTIPNLSGLYDDDFKKYKVNTTVVPNRTPRTVTVKCEFNIPSIAFYSYNSTPSTVYTKHLYKNLIEHISETVDDSPIIVPTTIVNNNNSNRYHHIMYYYPGSDSLNRTISDENSDEHEDIFNDKGGTVDYREHYLSNYKKEINESFQIAGIYGKTFVLVGSPTMFGWDMMLCPQKEYDSGEHCHYYITMKHIAEVLNNEVKGDRREHTANFQLRRENNRDHDFDETNYDSIHNNDYYDTVNGNNNTNNQKMGYMWYNNWYYLLWKNTNGEFTIVNKAIIETRKGTSTSEQQCEPSLNRTQDIINVDGNNKTEIYNTYIERILWKYKNSYFKLNVPKPLTGYKISDDIIYNLDYTVSILFLLTLENIQFSTSYNDILHFANNGVKTMANKSGSNLLIDANEIYSNKNNHPEWNLVDGDLLIFEILSTQSETINTKEKKFKIKGLDEFSNNVSKGEVYGVIEYNNEYYLKDNLNADLVDDIYILENSGFVSSSNVLDSDLRKFLASLKVNNDDIFIQKYTQEKLKYGHAAGRAPSKGGNSVKVGVVLGELPCFRNLTYDISDNGSSILLSNGLNIAHYYTINGSTITSNNKTSIKLQSINMLT